MSDIPKDLKYTKTHEWVRIEGNEATIGISFHAQDLLGDIVFVELPEKGEVVSQGEEFCVVESVKAAADVYAPLSGEILEVNAALEDAPSEINHHPYDDGWLVKIAFRDEEELSELLSADEYEEIASEEDSH